ncbi:Uncharacterized protein FWK35_00032071 [Aphis craccivora]|uniref:Uncharacterized protein n=1 Tax=Aphis craccivora TaxID=307492 RepID=A0A6G0XUU7_APHCR|nr:Uncharacterized protein FWK35_00032071 [Aphis craccivora]
MVENKLYKMWELFSSPGNFHKNNFKKSKDDNIKRKEDIELHLRQESQDVWIKPKDNIPKETAEYKIHWSPAANIRKISL